ncbi:Guanine-hypoxanthine permease [Parascardovia denticolens IPLA 20019]|uniref:NCS2 family permease n=1 Tax=Parascardovia denticolens TaxID=78258 RepID=UPI000266A93C|nr:NCS2 family permease [Parascardovia denticolens]EIT88928.1 Guanine-hypoxanthine permease [Parascardovia denticolens IPLA 20019]
MEKFFKLKENGTTASTEILAGLTTFFAMAYIVAVNPNVLGQAGMPWGAVFLATIIASIIGTLIMGLFANVPYALAPGVGLNAFFTFTVVKGLGFTWQQAMSMVFICGLINIIITATKLRKLIIQSIPPMLQHAISGGIGIFIAYIGLVDIGIIKFTPDKTAAAGANIGLARLDTSSLCLFLIGLFLCIVLTVIKLPGKWAVVNKGAFIIAMLATTLIGIPMGVTTMSHSVNLMQAVHQLPQSFMVIFTPAGFPSLFAGNAVRIPLALVTIFAFSLSDIFDTIGTFIGTGRRAGIFSQQDEDAMEKGTGFSSKMDKAMFADSTATAIGSLIGTSNTTTFVESAAGIAAGGRTGLTSVVVSICFLISAILSPVVSAIPTAATAPVLVLVGCMMMSSFGEIDWTDLSVAIPAFFSSIFMALSYSISYGIAAGFVTYCITKVVKREAKEVHPIVWGMAFLFILDLTLQAVVKF